MEDTRLPNGGGVGGRMEQFAAYGHAIVSIAIFAMIGLLLGPLSAARKTSEGVESGADPAPDYSNATYRLHRAYLNAMEHAGLFVSVTVAAILAGASPFWVNVLASLFLVSRIVHLVVHLRGVGAPNMGPRTFIYTAGWACCLILGFMAVIGALT